MKEIRVGIEVGEFERHIVEHLEARGVSRNVAEHIAGLLNDSLDFKINNIPSEDKAFDAYICFAFGNKPDQFANLQPGPVNEALAQVVKTMYKDCPKLIIAQWEIGELLKKDGEINPNDVHSYGQDFDKVMGRPIYQSTQSFLAKVANHEDTAIKHLLVVAQWFHYARCVQEVENADARFVAVVDQDAMPKDFCSLGFGQLWTSSEERFVLHTLIGSLNRARDKKNKAWKEQQS